MLRFVKKIDKTSKKNIYRFSKKYKALSSYLNGQALVFIQGLFFLWKNKEQSNFTFLPESYFSLAFLTVVAEKHLHLHIHT